MNQNKENELTRAANDCPLIKDPIFNHQRWGYKRENGEWITEPIFSVADNFEDGIARVRLGITWGYLNEDGSWSISPQFDYAEPFIGSVAIVRKGLFLGLIDRQGNWVIPPELIEIGKYSDVDLYKVKDLNGKYGLLDGKGQWIVAPEYDRMGKISEGRIKVEKDQKWGFINTAGEIILEPLYQNVSEFNDGLAKVTIINKTDSLTEFGIPAISIQTGFIGLDGQWEIPMQDTVFGDFEKGVATISRSGKKGLINKKGEQVVACRYDDIENFSEGLARVYLKEKYGFIDIDGNEIVAPIYDLAGEFQDGLAEVRVKKGNRYYSGMINSEGIEVIPTKYTWIGRKEKEGLIPVSNSKGKYGFFNSEGKLIIDFILDEKVWFKNGKAKVKSGGKEGILNLDGTFVGGCLFEKLDDFHDGIAKAKENGLWGFINEECQFVILPKFDKLGKFDGLYSCAKVNGRWGWIDSKGEWVIEPQFDETTEFNNKGYAKVKFFVPQLRDSKWGLIDTSGKWIISPAFDSEEDVRIPADKNDENKLYPSRDKESGLWGWKKYNGDWAILPIYQEVTDFVNSRASFLLKGKWGVTDEKGKIIIKPKLAEPVTFDYPCKWVRSTKREGLVDLNGNWIIPLEITSLPMASNDAGINIACLKDKWGVLDRLEGKWIIQPLFEQITPIFFDTLYKVKNNGKVGILDSKGEWIMPMIFDEISDLNLYYHGFAKMKSDGKYGLWNLFLGEWAVKPEYAEIGYDYENENFIVEKEDFKGFINKVGELL